MWSDITQKCESVWFEAMGKLGVIRPTDVPHATDYVQSMIDMINTLVTADKAYVTDDGVYLSIASVPDYGLLAHQSLDDMLSGGGDREVFGATNKRHPSDFALWKFSKPSEPSWSSPWGDGRPGWHSECVVMSLDLLGEGFDLHCGGADLRFPHHENERAQAVALGKTFANHWMHNGFVVDIEGEKMSKSLGNVLNLIDLLEKYDPRAYRLLLLQTHYRSPTRVGEENIDACVSALAGLDSFAARTAAHSNGSPDPTVMNQFTTAMNNDLDTTTVMALVFDSVRRANSAMDAGDVNTVSSVRAAVIEILGALGLELSLGDDIDADIVAKGEALDAARTAKDFVAADALRDELQSLGYVVETSKDGTRIRRG